jgi:hypothetical protein
MSWAPWDAIMDVLDAGVYVSKWEARVPKHTKVTLWGPLQAKEMGLEGWEFQDGGETGFVSHNAGVALTMGRATSTLIFVRRMERAFLTIYFGGYPADVPAGQRKLDMQKAVKACEIFLTRLAKEPVKFEFMGELTLVDNVNDASLPAKATQKAVAAKANAARLAKGEVIDADDEIARKAGYLPAVTTQAKAKAKPVEMDDESDTIVITAKPKGRRARGDDEDEAEHVEGAPSWVRVPKGDHPMKPKAKDEAPKKGKGKNEVWEV